jgi:hypothetical protein
VPLAQGFADVLNKVASAGYAPWAVNASQSIFGRSFAPFGLQEGTNFMEYDLVYLRGDLLFWGARDINSTIPASYASMSRGPFLPP